MVRVPRRAMKSFLALDFRRAKLRDVIFGVYKAGDLIGVRAEIFVRLYNFM
jgi:hypothetical protein